LSITRRFTPRTEQFTIISNDWARDERLSWKARGLLVWLLTHRVGWETSVDRIAQAAPDGPDSVKSGLRELEEAGYLVRVQDRADGGRWSAANYDVVDPGSPSVGYPPTGKPSAEEPPPKKTINKKTINKTPPLAPLAGTPSSTRGTRLDESWMPPPSLISEMRAERPDVHLELEHRKFVDYWTSQPGRAGLKLRWDATWRNWIRNARGTQSASSSGYRHTTSDDAVAAVEALRTPPADRRNPLLPREIAR
jgi:hypothetical protein